MAPTEEILTLSDYARTYQLLRHLTYDKLEMNAYTNYSEIDGDDLHDNVSIIELGRENKIVYSVLLYRSVYESLHSGEFDIYHHANLDFRGFNPAVLLPPEIDIPLLIGPAEGGHAVPEAEFKRVMSRQVQYDIPEFVETAAAKIARPIVRNGLNPIRETIFGATLRRADRIVAVHSDAKQKLERYTDADKIEVIPYGVDMEKFPFEAGTGDQSFVTIGNLIERKGHRYLLNAMETVTEEYPNAELHVVGTGPLREELKSQAVANNVADSVTFHGFVDDDKLVELLHQARAFVHPSLSEGFSHVRLEAMSSGCPVIGTDVSGAHDLTRDGTDGHIVPTGDSQALTDAMLELLENDGLVEEMGRNAREKVERDHDYADIAQRYLEIYREMAE